MELNVTKVLKGAFLVECNDGERRIISIDNIDEFKIEELPTEEITNRLGIPVRTFIPPQVKASFKIIPSELGELFNVTPAEFPDTDPQTYEYVVDKLLTTFLDSFNIKEGG